MARHGHTHTHQTSGISHTCLQEQLTKITSKTFANLSENSNEKKKEKKEKKESVMT